MNESRTNEDTDMACHVQQHCVKAHETIIYDWLHGMNVFA